MAMPLNSITNLYILREHKVNGLYKLFSYTHFSIASYGSVNEVQLNRVNLLYIFNGGAIDNL